MDKRLSITDIRALPRINVGKLPVKTIGEAITFLKSPRTLVNSKGIKLKTKLYSSLAKYLSEINYISDDKNITINDNIMIINSDKDFVTFLYNSEEYKMRCRHASTLLRFFNKVIYNIENKENKFQDVNINMVDKYGDTVYLNIASHGIKYGSIIFTMYNTDNNIIFMKAPNKTIVTELINGVMFYKYFSKFMWR